MLYQNAFVLTIIALLLGTSHATAAPVSVDTSATGAALAGKSSVGITTSSTSRPYLGIGSQNAALPYFSLSANQFYLRGLDLGYTASNTDTFSLDVIATPRFLGYSNDDSLDLAELEGTNYSIHAGVSLTVPINKFQLNTQLVTDILGESNGSEITSSLSRTFSYNKFSVTAAANVNWQDKNLVNHYYGIDTAESSGSFTPYAASSTFNIGTSLTTSYALSNSISAIGTVSVNQFGDEIANSPIVENDQTTAVSLGIIYSF